MNAPVSLEAPPAGGEVPVPLQTGEVRNYLRLVADEATADLARAKSPDASGLTRARFTEEAVYAWQQVATIAEGADPNSSIEQLRATFEQVETVLQQNTANMDRLGAARQLNVVKEVLGLLDPNDPEAASKIRHKLALKQTQSTPQPPIAEQTSVDVEALSQREKLVGEVIEAARGSVAGSVNTSREIMARAQTEANRRGRRFVHRYQQGWNTWGEVQPTGLVGATTDFADKKARMIREAVVNGGSLDYLQELRLKAKVDKPGYIDVGLSLFVPRKTDEFGRPSGDINIYLTLPAAVAKELETTYGGDPTVVKSLVEALMSDYGFPPEVMQTMRK